MTNESDFELPEPTRKEQILSEIVRLEKEVEERQFEWKVKHAKIKSLSDQRDALDLAYRELSKKIESVNTDLQEHRFLVDKIVRQGKSDKQTAEELRRELSRLIDAERVNKAYQEQVEAFREACLTAPWREENRTDNLGAFEYQIDGAIRLAVAKKGLLGDKRGLGKSLTSQIWCDFIEAKRVIAVCPSDTLENFVREIMLWTPHRAPVLIGKLPRGERDFLLKHLRVAPHFMVIINYEAWRRDPQLIKDLQLLEAETVLFDESHIVKTASSSAYKGVHDIVFANNKCDKCGSCRIIETKKNSYRCKCGHVAPKWEFSTVKNVLPMTGTPILNRPQELFTQIHLIAPDLFPEEKTYLQDFCIRDYYTNHWKWRAGGEKRVIEMLGPRLIVRNKKDAGVIIPPPTRIEHLITREDFRLDYPKQFEAYEQARKYAQIVLDPDNQIAMSMPAKITVLLRLRQVLVWPAAVELKWRETPDGPEHRVNLSVYESVKLDKAEQLIKEIIEEGDRVVLFSMFKPGLHELQKRLGKTACIYDGETSSYLRNQIQLDFDIKTAPLEPRWQVVLANYKSGGVGLNFNAATHMILLDPEWNPGKDDQAVGRIDRIGQKKETNIHDIRVESSVDTWMAELLEEKQQIIEGFEGEIDIYGKAYNALRKGKM